MSIFELHNFLLGLIFFHLNVHELRVRYNGGHFGRTAFAFDFMVELFNVLFRFKTLVTSGV